MTVGLEPSCSQHSTGRLVRELIATRRPATAAEIALIVERMATAPFASHPSPVRLRHRGLIYQGRALRAQDDSLFYHLVKRVLVDEQWALGSTADQYLGDLRRAVADSEARLGLYERHGDHVAVTLTATARVLGPARRGIGALPELLVVYSAEKAIIISGYQVSGLETTHVPRTARWLK